MNKLTIPFLFLACLFMAACSNDEPEMPSEAIALNMMSGDSNTTIGGSDVYINASNNFTSSYCGIADLGKKGGANKSPNLTQIAQEAAVIPGNYYQITLARDIRTVAGERAYPIDASFYNVYVESWIYDKDNAIEGARIRYAECYPEPKGLPEWDARIDGNMKFDFDNSEVYTYTYTFSKGSCIEKGYTYFTNGYANLTEALNFEINGNVIKVSYRRDLSSSKPDVELFVRNGSTYTRVYLNF
ncbi:MAG: DUF5036 family protein [Muribaculaceae bacterium]|nr:DUF5036 family protein [Muribaculaceae bacterium]